MLYPVTGPEMAYWHPRMDSWDGEYFLFKKKNYYYYKLQGQSLINLRSSCLVFLYHI